MATLILMDGRNEGFPERVPPDPWAEALVAAIAELRAATLARHRWQRDTPMYRVALRRESAAIARVRRFTTHDARAIEDGLPPSSGPSFLWMYPC